MVFIVFCIELLVGQYRLVARRRVDARGACIALEAHSVTRVLVYFDKERQPYISDDGIAFVPRSAASTGELDVTREVCTHTVEPRHAGSEISQTVLIQLFRGS